MKFTDFNIDAKRTSFRHGVIFGVGEYVSLINEDKVGKVHRRGPNYVIAITEEGEMFRAWVEDIKEYKQFNKSGDPDSDHRLVGTPQHTNFTKEHVPGSDHDGTKSKNINKKNQVKENKMNSMEEGLKAARKNVGASKCWDGYKAKGTKMKDGKEVPNCVKEEETIEEKKGLYANIHAKRKRGEAPAKPGDEDYPAKDAFKKSAKTAKEEVELDEVAPPGSKYERMVKHIKKNYSKDGKLTDKEKSIAYATAWKQSKNEQMEYVEEKKKLDPVGKEDGDVDNDGDKDSSDSYLLKRRATVSAAIKAKKGTKKEGFSDWRTELMEKDSKDVTVMPEMNDNTDPDNPSGVFDKNKKLKGVKNGMKSMKEECGGCDQPDCGSEKCVAKRASKVKRRKYQDGVNEEIITSLNEHRDELKSLYLN
jgi:hypothetical protein